MKEQFNLNILLPLNMYVGKNYDFDRTLYVVASAERRVYLMDL